ncbi:unnamed protein product, partial [Didymodactylos carnosus]
ALNYQHCDSHMALNYGRFLDNGGCGYVLKPDFLTDPNSEFDTSSYSGIVQQRLTLRIISGQFLSNESSRDIVDPYVHVITYGYYLEMNTYYLCKGLNPQWNETMVFNISVPELCLVRFVVFDYDKLSKNDLLVSFCLPMSTMQTGYRHIHLRDTCDGTTYSTLFVHVDIQPLKTFASPKP